MRTILFDKRRKESGSMRIFLFIISMMLLGVCMVDVGHAATEDVAVIETVKGTIVFRFFDQDAPNTVDNFKKLAKENFYNGLTFHRVVKTPRPFVIQGGCPKGDGTGGPGYFIPAEFNQRKHLEGTVAMARSAHPDSAGSQFYICLAPQPFLDGQYTVFGQVITGLDVVHAIDKDDVMTSVRIEQKEI